MLPDIINPVRRRLEADELALGMVVRMARSGDIARIAATSGHDFLFLDVQHAIYSLETISHIAQVALGCGVAPFVRVRSCRDPNIPVMLDAGVTGIVAPDVNTADDARAAVQACKFAPIGTRSVTSGYPIFNYRPVPMQETIALLNTNTLVVCMIESLEGLGNIDAIAAVEGVDVLHVGLTDMLADMGKPGAYGDPQAMEAVARITASALAHGKYAGVGGDNDPMRQQVFLRQGVRFISTQSDGAMLLNAATKVAGNLRRLASEAG
ncbi:MAG TPA: aldolase/citrate lyase family protein [Rhodopila sp.]|uniref:HpcH/HpaI aldolase family protein n=1 Tax=Rhodopila sp. TaxID=2480087 RepID=UPI002B829E48|nr:aldolase/citrate lyase family protein [Rhodopila sp.]HVY13993.1 aldolase/citrate lyase family protein [Rhodopila sp.]